jgi:hypothetical protein
MKKPQQTTPTPTPAPTPTKQLTTTTLKQVVGGESWSSSDNPVGHFNTLRR